MPLYKRRVNRPFLSQTSQKTGGTQDTILEPPTKKTFPDFKQPTCSQRGIEDILQMKEIMNSPLYPEVFPRNASEPNESAFVKYDALEELPEQDTVQPLISSIERQCVDDQNTKTCPDSISTTSNIFRIISDLKISPKKKTFEGNDSSIDTNVQVLQNLDAINEATDLVDLMNAESTTTMDNPHSLTVKENEGVTKNNTVSSTKKSVVNSLLISKSQNRTKKHKRDKKKVVNGCRSEEDILGEPQISVKEQKSQISQKQLNNSFNSSQSKISEQVDKSLNSSKNSQFSHNSKNGLSSSKSKKDKKSNENDSPVIFTQNSDISMNDPVVKSAYKEFMKKKKNFTRIDTPKKLSHFEKMKWLQEQRNVGVYVHCDKCDKIRYLEETKDPTELPLKWYCRNNPDTLHNKCEDPEEEYPLHIQEDWIDNLYNAGSLVWARVEGYPWWPGLVDDDPNTESYYWLDNEFTNTPSYYHVTFFDSKEVTRAWLKPNAIKAFVREMNNPALLPEKFSLFKKRIDFALKVAEEAVKMPLAERLNKFGFLSRYKKPINKPKDFKCKEISEEADKLLKEKMKNGADKKRNDKHKKLKKRGQKYDLGLTLDDFPISSSAIGDISWDLFEDI